MTGPGQPFRILVVDDEPAILDLIREILEPRGWIVETFESAVEALQRAKRACFDALVLDLYMPELPGMLFHAKLKVLDAELAERTVFVTGHFARSALRRDLFGSGHLLLKPFEAKTLTQLLEQVLPTRPREGAPA